MTFFIFNCFNLKNSKSLTFSIIYFLAIKMFRKTNPIGRCKINGFSKIESLIVSGMIGSRKSDNKFSGILMHRVDLQTFVNQKARIQRSSHMMKKVWLANKQFRNRFAYNAVELFRILAAECVPYFTLSPK